MLERITGKVWRLLSKILFPFLLEYKKITIGKNFIVYGLPIITLEKNSDIIMGNNIVLCSQSNRTALGVSKPVIIRTMKQGAVVNIGDDVGFSGVTICAMQKITIGSECLFGADVSVFDNDFHPLNPIDRRRSNKGIAVSPVSIGNNVFIGTKAMIMKGVTIGNNSVIGAGSVVVSDIPDNVVAAGNPCKVIRELGQQ